MAPTQRQSNSSANAFATTAFKFLLFASIAAQAVSAHGSHGDVVHDAEPALSANETLDACALSVSDSAYSQSFHIAGIFIALAVSSVGILLTMVLANSKSKRFTQLLQILKMFGIGVLAGTAWIHLLPHAFEEFQSPCLDAGWAKYGTGYVGLFGLIAAFIVQLIEMSAGGGHGSRSLHAKSAGVKSGTASNDHDHDHTGGMDVEEGSMDGMPHPHSHSTETSVILLEAGIMFHSIIIGVTLGVTPDDAFGTLLAAICFHQMFEGMALGVLIGNLRFSNLTKTLLCIMYPLITPIGIAIGIAVRSTYNENSPGLILTHGILNSLSAGILFYNTYAELMSEEISHNNTFRSYTLTFKAACFMAMYLGAAAMAIIALWA
ncbi:hypothetical protein CcCBS67573_g00282 [Chytriomyces confervae]|uniref:Zinc/iron permease n=1 Tax=Chytriomyces confervae TaxID=246404 RepID=A0A507FSI0_9FUNG|nr:hypothetical protein CcCBS67573_g00282 [Chytriomyces confervae]